MHSLDENGYRILILEDEVIIADTLTRHLERNGHRVVGAAMSYEEGVEIMDREAVDLAILDLRVDGTRTGVDFAHYLRQLPKPVPFIFLTSQIDSRAIDQVRQTYPSGYLSKPVQVDSLLTTVEVAVHNSRARRVEEDPAVTLRDGKSTHRIPVQDIEFLQANHVYVHVNLRGQHPLLLRSTLGELIEQIGEEHLLHIHRSYAVNPKHITRYDREQVWIGDQSFPVSRGRRQEVTERLQRDGQHRSVDRNT